LNCMMMHGLTNFKFTVDVCSMDADSSYLTSLKDTS